MLESLNIVLPLVKNLVGVGGKENKPSLTVSVSMWTESRGQEEVEDSACSRFPAALGSACLWGGIVYPNHSQSSLTASPVSPVPFPETALVSGTGAIGHHSESCSFWAGNILQGQVPLVLWPIFTSPETIRMCRNYMTYKKKGIQNTETWNLAL